MKAYKGFNLDLTCRGFQYEEGKTYETDKAELCKSGFHVCENPIMCFGYYAPGASVYHAVELEDVALERESDTKCVGKKITIGAKIGIPEICQLTFEYVKAHCANEHNAKPGEPASAGSYGSASAGYRGAASAGESGAASAGSYGSASAGYRGAASAGESGSASAGESGSASAGENGSASAGSYGAASAGENGSASAGYRGAASAGSYGAASAGYRGSASAGSFGSAVSRGSASAGSYGSAVSRGSAESGANGISVARGNDVKVKGGLGAILVIVKENACDYGIREWKAVEVDGEKIKADTWYKLVNGELTECE